MGKPKLNRYQQMFLLKLQSVIIAHPEMEELRELNQLYLESQTPHTKEGYVHWRTKKAMQGDVPGQLEIVQESTKSVSEHEQTAKGKGKEKTGNKAVA